jgi:hypothetical protein
VVYLGTIVPCNFEELEGEVDNVEVVVVVVVVLEVTVVREDRQKSNKILTSYE